MRLVWPRQHCCLLAGVCAALCLTVANFVTAAVVETSGTVLAASTYAYSSLLLLCRIIVACASCRATMLSMLRYDAVHAVLCMRNSLLP